MMRIEVDRNKIEKEGEAIYFRPYRVQFREVFKIVDGRFYPFVTPGRVNRA